MAAARVHSPRIAHDPRLRIPLALLAQELRTGLALPEYRGVEWRLQVQLGGRYVARKAPQASFLLRLHTSGGPDGTAEHLMQADLPNLRRLASELEVALKEDKSSHSRRIARRL